MSKPKQDPAQAPYSSASLVSGFLDYYAQRGHTVVESAPLVPADPTLLFTAAGMVQFKEHYNKPDAAPYSRATSVQKCLRAGGKQSDLENVGRTLRHNTFFEMLGNFSFGDYFKKETIETAWDLSIQVWSMDPQRVWVSVFTEDDEAYDLWTKHIGVPSGRMVRLGKMDNFWGPVGDTGVCGPSSELYYDTGEERGCERKDCKPGCECERYIEFWNLVFPQFYFTEAGRYDRLPKPGIDTGLGLERLAFLLQNAKDNFHTDLFLPIRKAVASALPNAAPSEKLDLAINAAADHVRALVFALSEGVMPSNEGRGYVLRRLLRRALTKMHPFGVKKPILGPAVDAVIGTMSSRYSELPQRADLVKKVITGEEAHFLSTIEQGWDKLQALIERGKKDKSLLIAGADAFVLYDTYGFPLEMTVEFAQDAGLTVDEAAYAARMQEQKERSRRHVTFRGAGGQEGAKGNAQREFVSVGGGVEKTEFIGYEELTCDASIRAYRVGDANLAELIADRTVFYPLGGGQVGDRGVVDVGERRLNVLDTFRDNDRIVHIVEWGGDDVGSSLGDETAARFAVDSETRRSTERNHTATHLVHRALREILGDHVTQAGSLVAPERLRFDFHHFQPLSDDELMRVERMVNEAVLDDRAVSYETIPYRQAITQGAMALFGEKYGDDVRMVTIEDFSKELCGGTHIRRTGETGLFVLTHETAVAAGVRRIEALTGTAAFDYFTRIVNDRARLADRLRIAPGDIDRRVQQLLDENEALKKKLGEQESRQTAAQLTAAVDDGRRIGDVRLVALLVGSGDVASLRRTGDELRGKMDLGIGLLGLVEEKKSMVLIVVSDRLIKERAVRANDLAKQIGEAFSFRGGGKPHMAQLGIGGADDFEKVREFVEGRLGAQA